MTSSLPEILPPRFPLDRSVFRIALQDGLGRAMQQARRFGLAGFEDDVVAVATRWPGYDCQLEGDRVTWLAELCRIAGVVERVVATPFGDGEVDLRHHAGVLASLHVAGEPGVLGRLFEALRWDPRTEALLSAEDVLHAGGQEGLARVASMLAARLRDDPGARVEWDVFWEYDEVQGEGALQRDLRALADQDPELRPIVDALDDREPNASTEGSGCRVTDSWTDERLLAWFRDPTTRPRMFLRSHHRGTYLHRTIDGLLDDDPTAEALPEILRGLRNVGFVTLDPARLRWLDHEDDRTRWWAVAAWSHHADPALREAGLRAMDLGRYREASFLLTRSGHRRDLSRIDEVARSLPGTEDRHDLLGSLTWALEERHPIACAELAMMNYELVGSSICRRGAVLYLAEEGVLPDWIREEIAFDAHADIREALEQLEGTDPLAT